MKVFLTGGTGFIGQVLTRQLLQRGWEVITLVRHPESPQALTIQQLGATLVEGDILQINTMRPAMQNVDMVIHNAGMYELGINANGKKRMTDINVVGTENVLRLAQELAIKRTVYVSTTWVYGETGQQLADESFQRTAPYLTVYEETKSKAHEIALKYQDAGLPMIIACPHGVIGPNDHSSIGYTLRLHLNKMMAPFAWSPDSSFTFVYLEDLAEGIALVAEKGKVGETYILAGEQMAMREVFAIWATQPGGLKVRFFIPSKVASFMMTPLEPILRMLGLPAFMSRETVRVSSIQFVFTSQKAKDQLGWTHRSAKQMWIDTFEGEIALRNQRKTNNPLILLNPI